MRSFLFPFIDTIAKKLMKEKYILPLNVMKFRDLFEFLYLIIITPILIATSNLHFSSDIFSINLAIAAPIYIISSSIKSFLLLNVIYKFSAQSVSFLIISESLAGSIHEIIFLIIYHLIFIKKIKIINLSLRAIINKYKY